MKFSDENAVNLVYGLLGLQDNFDLDGFEVKRQSAMNALIASSPRKAAPWVSEKDSLFLSLIVTFFPVP